MSASPWRCEQYVAHLQLDPLRVTLDAAHPARGLTLAGQPVAGNLLGLDIPLQGPGDQQCAAGLLCARPRSGDCLDGIAWAIAY